MRRRPLVVSLAGILVLAFGSLLASLIAGNTPQLGLDLQGGASVTLRPVGNFDSAALDVVPDIYRSRIDSLGVAEPEIIRQGDTIVVNLPGVKDKERAIELIGVTGKVLFRPVLASTPLAAPINESKIPTEAVTTTTGPATTLAAGSETTLAGATETTTATAATSSSAGSPTTASTPSTSAPAAQGFLTPRAAASTAAPTTSAAAETTSTATGATTTTGVGETSTTVSGATTTTVAGSTATTVPFDPAELVTPNVSDLPEATVVLPGRTGQVLYQMGPAFALGENAISSASAQIQNGEWQVELVLKGGAGGLDAWNAMTAKCYSKAAECAEGGMAIVLDHRVISAPVPQTSFFSSPNIVISGGGNSGFTEKESKDLARVLKYGSTPIEMKAEAAQTVSATLGKDSLHAGVVAGIVGIALVVLLMLLYYRSLALVVVAGLLVSASLLWSVISLLSKTSGLALTLAGVTGIIVSIGVTVDSYVVFFERLKDEVRSGRSLRSSAQRGFKSSWRTILAADTVSLIGAAVLWYLSVGSVRGFAFFLGLSTLCDMVVAYFFTRPAVLLLSRTTRYQATKVFGIQTGEALAGGAS